MTTPSSPHVSVVIPVHNGEPYIHDAVRSALTQTHAPLEVIVVSDASTDGTADVVNSIADSRVRLIESTSNQGLTKTRNIGARHAKGDVVAFLDHDDTWVPQKLEKQVALLKSDSSIVAVGCLLGAEVISGQRVATNGVALTEPAQQEAIARAELVPFEPSSFVIPAASLRKLDYFDETITIASVTELLSRATRLGRVACVNEILGTRRLHSESMMRRRGYQAVDQQRFIQARLVARARGEDLTWEEYREKHKPSLHSRRKDYAQAWRWSARVAITERRWARGLRLLFASAILDPLDIGRLALRRAWTGRSEQKGISGMPTGRFRR